MGDELGTAKLRATSGAKEGFGMTPMEALDDLMPHIQGDAFIPIVIRLYDQRDASTTGALDAVNEKGVGTPARF